MKLTHCKLLWVMLGLGRYYDDRHPTNNCGKKVRRAIQAAQRTQPGLDLPQYKTSI